MAGAVMGDGKILLSSLLFVAGLFAGLAGATMFIISIAPRLATLPGWLVGLGLLAISGAAFFGSYKLFGVD